jgi:hypothetical protein
MTGGTQAYPYLVSPRGGEAELVIKGNHAINIYRGYIKKPGNLHHRLAGKIAKLALNLLQDGYKSPPVFTEPA